MAPSERLQVFVNYFLSLTMIDYYMIMLVDNKKTISGPQFLHDNVVDFVL